MQRYFIYLSYDGTAYHGWQVQPNGISVQEEMQKALSTLLRQDIEIVGAGRTDAGVHARVMVAHFDFEQALDVVQLAYKLNRILPKDISVSKVMAVSTDMHARFSAVKRTYHYYIHLHKDPFHRFYSCELHYELDFRLMNEAAAYLLECSDFAAFCKVHTDVKTTICKVTEARWIDDGGGCWHFVISADRFLRNMVRAVVGTLIDVGRHRLTLEQFKAVVEGKNRSNAGESMPGNALFLEDVKYPFDV
ncbi:tRNA pseudouridine(38-40) synthase TruA [uncultured Prevotella sp.]|uniref:tRNA pseudouridine(38-40) synthase TruA n=1 Tax=uncultured Prevotella sp. TaxID=159272 RepID=UPI002623DD23|nr:tRNA pseudouridine(38-40) synthase TruA [uncultured Prevotella sp.]